jgi:hypothetical protein
MSAPESTPTWPQSKEDRIPERAPIFSLNQIHGITSDRHQFVLHPDKVRGEKLSDSSRLLFSHSFACEASPVTFQLRLYLRTHIHCSTSLHRFIHISHMSALNPCTHTCLARPCHQNCHVQSRRRPEEEEGLGGRNCMARVEKYRRRKFVSSVS